MLKVLSSRKSKVVKSLKKSKVLSTCTCTVHLLESELMIEHSQLCSIQWVVSQRNFDSQNIR